MGRVRSRDTKPELLVRRFLHSKGLRFRLHRKELPGRPDLVFPSRRIVVFVHGCFWHQHPGCRKAKLPETRAAFWREKLLSNVQRDQKVQQALEAAGWHPLIVWECELTSSRLDALADMIRRAGPDEPSSHDLL